MAVWNPTKAIAAFETFGLTGTNAAMAVYWLSLWSPAAPPQRSSFNPARVRDLLPAIGLAEVREQRAVCRLSGRYIDMAMGGALCGVDMFSLVGGEQRQLRKERLTALVHGRIALSRTRYTMCGATYVAETLQLPFFGETEDGARQYLAHTNWRPATSDTFMSGERELRPGMPDEYLFASLI